MSDGDDEYEVGYGRPPKKSQFKKGRSGNPKGRPRGAKNYKTIVKEALDRKIEIKVNGRRMKVSQYEAVVTRVAGDAMSGKPRQMAAFLDLPHRFGLIEEEERLVRSMSEEDRLILERYVKRRVDQVLKVLS
ncbi:MAG: DUF5681 domain-containing protein [Alphaproteobacteria bacterium]